MYFKILHNEREFNPSVSCSLNLVHLNTEYWDMKYENQITYFIYPSTINETALNNTINIAIAWYCLVLQLLLNLNPYRSVRKIITKEIYRQTSNVSRTLEGNKIADHSDVVGASPVAVAPTTFYSRLNTWFQWIGQGQYVRGDDKYLGFGI